MTPTASNRRQAKRPSSGSTCSAERLRHDAHTAVESPPSATAHADSHFDTCDLKKAINEAKEECGDLFDDLADVAHRFCDDGTCGDFSSRKEAIGHAFTRISGAGGVGECPFYSIGVSAVTERHAAPRVAHIS